MATVKGKSRREQRNKYDEFELSNSILLNRQLHTELTHFKQQKKLQRMIHEKTAWKDYTR